MSRRLTKKKKPTAKQNQLLEEPVPRKSSMSILSNPHQLRNISTAASRDQDQKKISFFSHKRNQTYSKHQFQQDKKNLHLSLATTQMKMRNLCDQINSLNRQLNFYKERNQSEILKYLEYENERLKEKTQRQQVVIANQAQTIVGLQTELSQTRNSAFLPLKESQSELNIDRKTKEFIDLTFQAEKSLGDSMGELAHQLSNYEGKISKFNGKSNFLKVPPKLRYPDEHFQYLLDQNKRLKKKLEESQSMTRSESAYILEDLKKQLTVKEHQLASKCIGCRNIQSSLQQKIRAKNIENLRLSSLLQEKKKKLQINKKNIQKTQKYVKVLQEQNRIMKQKCTVNKDLDQLRLKTTSAQESLISLQKHLQFSQQAKIELSSLVQQLQQQIQVLNQQKEGFHKEKQEQEFYIEEIRNLKENENNLKRELRKLSSERHSDLQVIQQRDRRIKNLEMRVEAISESIGKSSYQQLLNLLDEKQQEIQLCQQQIKHKDELIKKLWENSEGIEQRQLIDTVQQQINQQHQKIQIQ